MPATSPLRSKRLAVPLLLACALCAVPARAIVQHELTVDLEPDRNRLSVRDRVQLPEGFTRADGRVDFLLNSAFEPALGDATARLERLAPSTQRPLHRYRAHLARDARTLTIIYAGALAQAEGHYASGHVGPEGVFLTETSAWYPIFEGAPIVFSMQVRAPEGWHAISQGRGDPLPPVAGRAAQLWTETRPQTEIVLLAGQFVDYMRRAAGLDASVHLRRPDAGLAADYLDATARYLDLYEALLGPYPYEKFALVENFWETGYGLPSLAVLGPRVIRFPFILHSSFPHEILHNWWGNGVYLDPGSGNWSEGLTAYLADHLVREQRGRGARHRRNALQKYASYVDAADDFPLSAFRGKHGEVSQAVGYSKALMFFHMLRQHLGDADFLAGLRLFASRHRFQAASYDDLRRAFESASGLSLGAEFAQWIERTGAPSLLLKDVRVERTGGGYRLRGTIEQQQPGPPYRLRVPVAVQLGADRPAVREAISLDSTRAQFELALPSRPTALHVDPEFDLFRRLAPGEAPASLGDLLGAKAARFVLPAREPARRRETYTALVRSWDGGATIDDAAPLPDDESVWLLGWDNAHLPALAAAAAREGLTLTHEGATLGADRFRRATDCVVFAARAAADTERRVGFIGCDGERAIDGLARKLPHYGRYGFLAFRGDEPRNVRKQEWPVRDSPLAIVFDPKAAHFPPPLPPRRPLAASP